MYNLFIPQGSGGVTIGNSVSGGTVNQLLYVDNIGNLAQSSNLIYDGTSYNISINEKLTINGLANTTSPGITLQNTTSATSGTKQQYPPALYFIGRQWNNSSSVPVGWRIKQTNSNTTTNLKPVLDFDFTTDGSTYTNVFKSAISGGAATFTLTGSVTTTGTLNANGGLNASNGINVSGSSAQLTAGIGLPITTKTTNYSVTSTDCTVLANTNSGDITITLPDVATVTNQIFNIKKIDAANTLTINTVAGNIDGSSSLTITTNYQNTQVQSNGVNYFTL